MSDTSIAPKAHWNLRVIRHPDGTLAVHEVHYCDGEPASYSEPCSEEAEPLGGEDEDTLLAALADSAKFTFDRTLAALSKPILDAETLT